MSTKNKKENNKEEKFDEGWTLVEDEEKTQLRSLLFIFSERVSFWKLHPIAFLRVAYALFLGIFSIWLVQSGIFLRPFLLLVLNSSVLVLYLHPAATTLLAVGMLVWVHAHVLGSNRDVTQGSAYVVDDSFISIHSSKIF